MKTRIDKITVDRAFEIAAMEDCPPALWEQAEAALIAAGLCPYCACDGHKSKLAPWEPGDRENYAGRECYECESFIACGTPAGIDYLREDEPDLDAAGCCYSDANPGL